MLPLGGVQWDKKWEYGQIRCINKDEVLEKIQELRRNPLGASAKVRIIVWRDVVGQ